MSTPARKQSDANPIQPRVRWRDVGYSWVAAVIMTTLLLLTL